MLGTMLYGPRDIRLGSTGSYNRPSDRCHHQGFSRLRVRV